MADHRVEDLVAKARRRLAAAPFEPSPREAALLLGWVLGWSEAQVLARGDVVPEPEALMRFEALLERRLSGEPVAYLLGEREFYGREFQVDLRVLIPRPETEHLVEAALEQPLPPAPRILDVGTGSGCIAVTLAAELPDARVTATDLSLGALAVAAANARRLGVGQRVHFAAMRLEHLGTGFELGAFDLMASNPPYIDPADAATLSPEIRNFEPALALYSETSYARASPSGDGRAQPGGTHHLFRLLQAGRQLKPGATVALEVGHDQGAEVAQRAREEGFRVRERRKDYAGFERTLVLERLPPKATDTVREN